MTAAVNRVQAADTMLVEIVGGWPATSPPSPLSHEERGSQSMSVAQRPHNTLDETSMSRWRALRLNWARRVAADGAVFPGSVCCAGA